MEYNSRLLEDDLGTEELYNCYVDGTDRAWHGTVLNIGRSEGIIIYSHYLIWYDSCCRLNATNTGLMNRRGERLFMMILK